MTFMVLAPVSVAAGALAIVSALSLGSMLLITKVGDPFEEDRIPFIASAVVFAIAVLLTGIIILSQLI